MKTTGITRKIDSFGRIVIPKTIREQLDFTEDAMIEILLDDEKNNIVLSKFNRGCEFCGNMKNTKEIGKKIVCKECMERITEAVKQR